MKEFLDKISSYNLFNYFLPGIIFAFLADRFTRYSFIQEDLLIGAFLYYFIGLVVSRFGSLVLEPIAKRLKFVQFWPYKDYVETSKKDEKLDLLLEAGNTYRTLCSMFLLLLALKVFELIDRALPALKGWWAVLLFLILFIAFLFSFKKQIAYIKERIGAQTGKTL